MLENGQGPMQWEIKNVRFAYNIYDTWSIILQYLTEKNEIEFGKPLWGWG